MTFYFCLNGKRRLCLIISFGNAFRRFWSTAGVFFQRRVGLLPLGALLVRPLLIPLATAITAHFWHKQLNQWNLVVVSLCTTFAAFWLFVSVSSFPDLCFWPMDPAVHKILRDAGRVTIRVLWLNDQSVPWPTYLVDNMFKKHGRPRRYARRVLQTGTSGFVATWECQRN